MAKNDHLERYDQLFVTFSNKIEKWMKAAGIILLVALVIIQVLMQYPAIRYWLSIVERVEGVKL